MKEASRPTAETVPELSAQRRAVERAAGAYVQSLGLRGPFALEELRQHAKSLLGQIGMPERFIAYAAVMLNNALWREGFAAVPYERRLLLLPQCLRDASGCAGEIDELGLMCAGCGRCAIHEIQEEAERLGYAVLVAEGSAVVMGLIQARQIDAIMGVSCLNVLEKAFPHMEAAAVPGMALPLLQDDCRNTQVDLETLWETLHLSTADSVRRIDLTRLHETVDGWFSAEELARAMGRPTSHAEALAHGWLAKGGKRWRPFLAAAVAQALQPDPELPLPETFRPLAIAVECFHKASLVHDDIEDNDAERYGSPAMHIAEGTPVALNVGDLLIGEGYRLIANARVDAGTAARMLQVAAAGHHALCVGQGAELNWMRRRVPLSSREVLEVFRQKTAPAFEVALRIGALFATHDEGIQTTLSQYSAALGVAYQIRDDMEDFAHGMPGDDLAAARPSLLLALAYEASGGEARLERLWRGEKGAGAEAVELLSRWDVTETAQRLYYAYKHEAIRALRQLESIGLRGLLRRVITRIFADIEVEGWCREFAARHAPGGATSAGDAG